MSAAAKAQEQVVEEEEEGRVPIEKLQSLGINVSDINKLKSGGIYSVYGLLMRTKKVRIF